MTAAHRLACSQVFACPQRGLGFAWGSRGVLDAFVAIFLTFCPLLVMKGECEPPLEVLCIITCE